MLACGALLSIYINFICNMITFKKKMFLTFDPIQGQNVCLNVAAFVISFNLIYHMTMF